MDEFKDSKTALVADVDCTAGGDSLCKKYDVKGYPTIKYGDPADLKDYDGGRDYGALKKFAEENLGPTCGPDNLDLCDDDSKATIAKFQKMDVDELDTKIEEADEVIKKLDQENQKKVDKLQKKVQDIQSQIEKQKKKGDDQVAAKSKTLGLRFMKSVSASKKKKDEL
jgi:hypothetical protein